MLVVETRDLQMHQINSQKEHLTKSRESEIAMKAIGCGMRLASILSDRRTYSRRVRRMCGTIGPNRESSDSAPLDAPLADRCDPLHEGQRRIARANLW
jgi:hypothetical protein